MVKVTGTAGLMVVVLMHLLLDQVCARVHFCGFARDSKCPQLRDRAGSSCRRHLSVSPPAERVIALALG
jgi:hypothetical protein